MSDWYQQDFATVAEELGSDPSRGLSADEAARRLEQYGPNELVETGGRSPWEILWEQLSSPMVILLYVAAGVSAFLREYEDAVVILAIIVLNAILGFVQDYRAERAMAALKQMAVPTVRVRRDGTVQEISARELVPGDVVLLELGNVVPADGRLFEAHNLKAQEAALTGESEAIDKTSEPLSGDDLPLGDRRNMVYTGTNITYGRGQALITATGMQTELGRIARMLQSVEAQSTPLQKRLAQLGRGLAVAAVGIVLVVFVLGWLEGRDLELMLLTAISLAVAAVPEGLPAVATVTLAIGARRMFQRHALIRKLPAVETLGSVTVICSDKTGTLTENVMTVTVLDAAGDTIDLTAHLRRGQPVFQPGEERLEEVGNRPTLALLLAGGALCNDAELRRDPAGDGSLRAMGDPTEGAMVVAAARFGMTKTELDAAFPRVAEVPFDADRKRMTTVHRLPESPPERMAPIRRALEGVPGLQAGGHIAFTKGAVDSLLEQATHVWVNDRAEPLTDQWRKRIAAANDQLAGRGMRVLGVAFRTLRERPAEETVEALERELIFVGMEGMIDPPRPEVRDAVHRCRTAGIRPVMITGDHPLTARSIAQELGIAEDGEAVTGVQLARMPDDELERLVERVPVYARVSPEHKLRIVTALQNQGQVVAMTGDGVNDAPALKRADIGVAMGITGTDVSKEASNMVLLDDNFTTIVNAVEEGRIVYDNIRKFIKYTMTSNAGEIWVMLLPSILGLLFPEHIEMALPLLPLQILWVNLVTDGLPGLALGFEPAERGTMRRPPIPPGENIFARGLVWEIVWFGLLMGAVSFGVGFWYWRAGAETVYWRTMIFTVITLSQMGHALAVRSSQDSLFTIGLLSNKFLLLAVLITLVLQMAITYVPFLSDLFHTAPLTLDDLAIALVLSTVVFWGVEAHKWWLRRQGKSAA